MLVSKQASEGSIKVVVFDWDGTVVNSEAHIVACLGYAAEVVGLPVLSYESRKNIIGLGLREALLVLYPGLTEDQIIQLRSAYSEHFFSHMTSSLDLFEGVIDTLDCLKSEGYRLAVATGKSRNGLNKALESSGLGEYFDIERCADETRSKPDPLMLTEIAEYFDLPYQNMLMVGDTVYDLEMAQRVSMPRLGVSYGVHSRDRLLSCSPRAVIDQFSDVLRYLD